MLDKTYLCRIFIHKIYPYVKYELFLKSDVNKSTSFLLYFLNPKSKSLWMECFIKTMKVLNTVAGTVVSLERTPYSL